MLTTTDHRRDAAGLTHVYPVWSRRAAGLSIGINLNVDNTCNWQCVYCQVPGLQRGHAPVLDMALLTEELDSFLQQVLQGSFWQQHEIPAAERQLCDIAISGNGEPTTSQQFPQVVSCIGNILHKYQIAGTIPLRLITNGSMLQRKWVRQGIAEMATLNGEIWFKIDSVSAAGIRRINQVNMRPEAAMRRLRLCAEECPTWIQTCMFLSDGMLPSSTELSAWRVFLQQLKKDQVPLRGMWLYSIARTPMQEAGKGLGRLSAAQLQAIAENIQVPGLEISIKP